MDIYGPEFKFSGEPVGLFEDGVCPNSDGLFRYEPYRGPSAHAGAATEVWHRPVSLRTCWGKGFFRSHRLP